MYLYIFNVIRKYKMLPWSWSNQVYGPKTSVYALRARCPSKLRVNTERDARPSNLYNKILFRRRRVCWPLAGGWVGGNHNNNTTCARTPAATRRRWFFVSAARACMRRVAVLAASSRVVIRLASVHSASVRRSCRTLIFFLLLSISRVRFKCSVFVFVCWPRKTDTNDRSPFVAFSFILLNVFPDLLSPLLLHNVIGWKIVARARTVCRVLAPFPVRRTLNRQQVFFHHRHHVHNAEVSARGVAWR